MAVRYTALPAGPITLGGAAAGYGCVPVTSPREGFFFFKSVVVVNVPSRRCFMLRAARQIVFVTRFLCLLSRLLLSGPQPSKVRRLRGTGSGGVTLRSRKQSSGCLQGAPQAPERLCVIERSLRLYWTHPCPAASLFMAFYLLPQPDLTLASPPAG